MYDTSGTTKYKKIIKMYTRINSDNLYVPINHRARQRIWLFFGKHNTDDIIAKFAWRVISMTEIGKVSLKNEKF